MNMARGPSAAVQAASTPTMPSMKALLVMTMRRSLGWNRLQLGSKWLPSLPVEGATDGGRGGAGRCVWGEGRQEVASGLREG